MPIKSARMPVTKNWKPAQVHGFSEQEILCPVFRKWSMGYLPFGFQGKSKNYFSLDSIMNLTICQTKKIKIKWGLAYGAHSVAVNTTDCGSVISGSNPDGHP